MKIKALENRGIPYKIRKLKTRKISVVVKSDAVVNIRCYEYAEEVFVNEFVEKHIGWIEKQYLMYYQPQRRYINNERYLFLGKEYIMHVVEMKEDNVLIEGNYLVVYTTNNGYNHNKKLIGEFIKKEREMVFNVIFEKCFDNMKSLLKQCPKLEFKKYRARWGCCYYNTYKIILNETLIHLPLHLIECVIYHELTHLVYPSHNHEFYHLLGLFVNNPKKVQKELKQYSTIYE